MKLLSLWKGVIETREHRVSEIINAVAAQHRVDVREILSNDQTQRVCRARQHAMYEVRRRTSLSLPQIGAIFDRDHATVLHGCRVHEARLGGGRIAA